MELYLGQELLVVAANASKSFSLQVKNQVNLTLQDNLNVGAIVGVSVAIFVVLVIAIVIPIVVVKQMVKKSKQKT